MQRLLLWITAIPGLRTLVWHSSLLQKLAGYVVHLCIPKIRCEPYGFVMVCDSLSPTFLGLCAEGGYEKETAAFIAKSLRQGNTVIDVGANEGFYSALSSRSVGDTGRILAIEPDPVAVRCLRRNLVENECINVDIAEVCVGDTAGEITLHTSHVNGVNSLVRENVIGPSKPLTVSCILLDELLKEQGITDVDLMKIDIQGGEFSCLRGAEKTIDAHHPVIVCELWPEGMRRAGDDPVAMLDWLHEKGYRLRCLEDPALDDASMTRAVIVEAIQRRGMGYGGYANIAATPF